MFKRTARFGDAHCLCCHRVLETNLDPRESGLSESRSGLRRRLLQCVLRVQPIQGTAKASTNTTTSWRTSPPMRIISRLQTPQPVWARVKALRNEKVQLSADEAIDACHSRGQLKSEIQDIQR